MDYSFSGDFAAATIGPMTTAVKKQVWPDGGPYTMYDADPNGTFFSIVSDTRFAGGKACRMLYKKGAFGMGQQFYQLRVPSPQTVANLEFDWLFEPNFDLNPPNPQNLGGGKIGPCINWGEVGGVTEKRGTRAMWWYNANGSNNARPVYSPVCQDQRTGNQYVQPVKYTAPIVLDQMYRFRVRIFGGVSPPARANYWMDGPKVADSIEGQALQVTAQDDVLFDFAFFAGGGQENAPRWDCYGRHGNIKCWSGSSDTPPGPTPPDPTPPTSGQYRIEGTVTLTLIS